MNRQASLPHPILTAREMRACDEYAIGTQGVPSRVLMERAAGAVVDYLLRRTDLYPVGRVLVLCGSGNNGGDGLAVARFLSDGSRGQTREVAVLYVGRRNTETLTPDETAMSEECRRQYRLYLEAGGVVLRPDEITVALRESVAVVDAMLGIGLESTVRGTLPEVIEATVRSRLPVLALDIPTGVHADTGHIMGHALPARATVTVQALKTGLLLYPGAALCGDVAIADIGIPLSAADTPYATLADRALLAGVLPTRTRRSHKGTYGRVLAVCGSLGMSGAAVLCAGGALRTGTGLVEVWTPEENRLVLQISLPEVIVSPYDAEDTALGDRQDASEARTALCARIREAVGRASAVVVGCGLGKSETARFVLRCVLESMPKGRRVPLVLDADALGLLSEDEALWATPALTDEKRAVILTPHPVEMERLCAATMENAPSVTDILKDTLRAATDLAVRRGVTVVLKDAHTVVASPDGERYICPFGNAGMATGGSGDVLAGVIASLLGQADALDGAVGGIAAAGVCLHALAGDAAAEEMGEIGMLPSDLIRKLPFILKDFSRTVTGIEDV